MISTAAAAAVPYAWVAQTNPGGLVLTPGGTAYYPGGLLALTVHSDGTATGKIVGPASFMWLRAQRIPRYTVGQIMRDGDAAALSTTDLHPWYVASDADVPTAIGLRVPGCQKFYRAQDSDTGTLYLVDQRHRSWAALRVTPEPPYQVRQGGPTSSGTRSTAPTAGGSTPVNRLLMPGGSPSPRADSRLSSADPRGIVNVVSLPDLLRTVGSAWWSRQPVVRLPVVLQNGFTGLDLVRSAHQ